MPDIFVADKKEPGKKAGGQPSSLLYSGVMAKEKPTVNPLAAFVVRPKALKFETQEESEHVLLLLRQHPVTNVPWMLMAVAGVLLPLAVEALAGGIAIPLRFKVVGVAVWYLLIAGYMLEGFLSWYFNVFLITDERIIDIDFYSLIYKKFSSARIEQIEDITFTQGGLLGALFNYGNIAIQTAAEAREFELRHVPKPRKVVQFLGEMQNEEDRERVEGRVR